jgi:signal transduction histidine kinase
MRGPSIRVWLLIVSVLFALLVVGGIALTTYVIVSDGMQVVAADTTSRLASSAQAVVREAVIEAELSATAHGLSGATAQATAREELVDRLPQLLSRADLGEARFALYRSDLAAIWLSGRSVASSSQEAARRRALATGKSTRSFGQSGSMLHGLVSAARLGITVVHVPIALPGGERGVLDVTYIPKTEEQVIDAIRGPMAMLAISALLIMVVLMQTSMVWVLNLIDDLREAADSIDAGRLDDRLPEGGANEIGELARSLNHLIERLQRRSEAQAQFVADASHELATPVAGIRGYTGILRGWGAEDPTVRDEAIDAIDRESRRMARLTVDLLNLLHADQGLVLQSERFDLNALARDRLAATASRWIDKDIEFIGPEEGALTMIGDSDRVEDVISILLDNAAKYTRNGGSVALTTSRRRDTVTIEVADKGEGIPPEDLPRIFDRFFRSDKARAGGESGFGLGLAIAKSIVEGMGGSIDARSEAGVGSTFRVRLPRGRV